MTLGYSLYSKLIAEKSFHLDRGFRALAHEFEDGVDYVPTTCFVLEGHHFTSVAGAVPIVGPAIAAQPTGILSIRVPSTEVGF